MELSGASLDLIRSEQFRDHLRRVLEAYLEHCPGRLLSASVFGSVHRNEAVPGVSDLDMAIVLRDEFTASDRAWRRETEARLKREGPGFPNLPRADSRDAFFGGLLPGTDESLHRRSLAWAYFLRHDSTLLWGDDPTAGLDLPPPGRDWAMKRFPNLHDAVRQAAAPGEGDANGPCPPSVSLRKSARSAVLGGAYLLMALGEFRSFKVVDVVPALSARYLEWAAFLERTGTIATSLPTTESAEAEFYRHDLLAWMDYIGERMEDEPVKAT